MTCQCKLGNSDDGGDDSRSPSYISCVPTELCNLTTETVTCHISDSDTLFFVDNLN